MIKVMIWGSDAILDHQMESKVFTAMQKIITNAATAKIFFLDYSAFSNICRNELKKIQFLEQSRDKQIITVQANYRSQHPYEAYEKEFSDDQFFHDFAMKKLSRIQKYVLENCDAVLCYFYKNLDRREYVRIHRAEAVGKLRVINLVTPETEKKIDKCAAQILPARSYSIWQKINEGTTGVEVGKELNLSNERIRQIYNYSIREIKEKLNLRI